MFVEYRRHFVRGKRLIVRITILLIVVTGRCILPRTYENHSCISSLSCLGKHRFGFGHECCQALFEIAEGEVTHVLVRLKINVGGDAIESYEVFSFKKHAGEWKLLLLSPKIKQSLLKLKAMFG